MIKSLKIIQRLLLSLENWTGSMLKFLHCPKNVFLLFSSHSNPEEVCTMHMLVDIMSYKFLLMYNGCPLPLSSLFIWINKLGYLSCRMFLILDLAVVCFMVSFIFFLAHLFPVKLYLGWGLLETGSFLFLFFGKSTICVVFCTSCCIMHKISGCPTFTEDFIGSGEAPLYFYQFPYWLFTSLLVITFINDHCLHSLFH